MGLAADVGTLQRLPRVIGNDSLARELAYTARPFYADEAKQMGLVRYVVSSSHFNIMIYNMILYHLFFFLFFFSLLTVKRNLFFNFSYV